MLRLLKSLKNVRTLTVYFDEMLAVISRLSLPEVVSRITGWIMNSAYTKRSQTRIRTGGRIQP